MLWRAEAANSNISSSGAAGGASSSASSSGLGAAVGQSSGGTSTSSNTSGTSKSSITSCWTTSDADFGMTRVSLGTGMNVAMHLGMSVAEAADGLILNNAAGTTTDALNLTFQPSPLAPSPVSNDGAMGGFSTSYPIRNTTSLGTQEFLVTEATNVGGNENCAPATTTAGAIFGFDCEAAKDVGAVVSAVTLTPAALGATPAAAAATQPSAAVNSATYQALQSVQASPTGLAPVSSTSMQQKQLSQRPVNPPPSQPIICVPNQQAPYPHVQSSQARLGKGPVVKHMTTAPATQQRTPHLQQHVQHVHKFQQKPGGGVQVQTQVASQGRQVHHQTVTNQRYMQVGSSRSYIPSGHLPGRMQHLQMQSHSQKPLQMPRSMSAGVMGQMSASASPQLQYQAKASGAKQAQANAMINGHFVGGKLCPVYLSQLQGNAGENHLCRDRMADRVSVVVSDRKVRLVSENDPSSLYALCRRWVRNDTPRKEQIGYWDGGVQLPRPLSAEEVERACKQTADPSSEVEPEYAVDDLSESDLLQHHVRHFKNVRKRSRDQRTQKIARYKDRLQMLLPPSL